jgi:hypothetical protein
MSETAVARREPTAGRSTLDWLDRAECAGHDPRMWDVDPDHPGALLEAELVAAWHGRAVTICRSACPVYDACLARALELGEGATGTWAATTPAERREIRLRSKFGIHVLSGPRT